MSEYGGGQEFKIANRYQPPDPETPAAEWLYDCPCGEQHRLATAVTSALRCGKTGAELNEQDRFSTQVRPHKEVFPTDFRWQDKP